ncbi:hypothetical protein [Vibrio maritimus]|uniref:hypothetical protein n=1 Tax=Vibrio maritimus TaxID=990268 RepID=UPI001F3BEB31|nr:hypothetical protein [Vibrio maritimus]
MLARCYPLFFLVLPSLGVANGIELSLNSELRVYAVTQDDVNHPIALYSEIGRQTFKVDQYPFEGSDPFINGMSKFQLGSDLYVLVQVRWDISHYDIKGSDYVGYVYQLKNERLTLNKVISKDRNLQGFSGYQSDGSVSKYRYESTFDVVDYINSAYPNGYKINICSDNEVVALSCRLDNKKVVSLCKEGNALTYKYGMPYDIEITYPSDKESEILANEYMDSDLIKEYAFERQDYNYSLNFNISSGNINNFNNGYYELRVKYDGKVVFESDCREMLSDVYVSDWKAKL